MISAPLRAARMDLNRWSPSLPNWLRGFDSRHPLAEGPPARALTAAAPAPRRPSSSGVASSVTRRSAPPVEAVLEQGARRGRRAGRCRWRGRGRGSRRGRRCRAAARHRGAAVPDQLEAGVRDQPEHRPVGLQHRPAALPACSHRAGGWPALRISKSPVARSTCRWIAVAKPSSQPCRSRYRLAAGRNWSLGQRWPGRRRHRRAAATGCPPRRPCRRRRRRPRRAAVVGEAADTKSPAN